MFGFPDVAFFSVDHEAREAIPADWCATTGAVPETYSRVPVGRPDKIDSAQFSVTSPVARSESELPRSEPWLGVRPSSSNSGDGGSCSGSNGASFCGGGGGGPTQPTPFATSRGLADSGLDFLGTTDSVRDLLHLPYTRYRAICFAFHAACSSPDRRFESSKGALRRPVASPSFRYPLCVARTIPVTSWVPLPRAIATR